MGDLVVIDVCAGLCPDQLETNAPGTYGPILDTLRHLVEADRSYLVPLTDGTAEPIDETTMDLAALRAVMDENAAMWATVVAGDLDPERVVVRHRDDGSDSLAPLGVRLAQALHHGTDHRSQICTALTSLGIEPPRSTSGTTPTRRAGCRRPSPRSRRRAESPGAASALT